MILYPYYSSAGARIHVSLLYGVAPYGSNCGEAAYSRRALTIMTTQDTDKPLAIAQSESLSALFSYFKNWSKDDPTLKFRSDSVLTTNGKDSGRADPVEAAA